MWISFRIMFSSAQISPKRWQKLSWTLLMRRNLIWNLFFRSFEIKWKKNSLLCFGDIGNGTLSYRRECVAQPYYTMSEWTLAQFRFLIIIIVKLRTKLKYFLAPQCSKLKTNTCIEFFPPPLPNKFSLSDQEFVEPYDLFQSSMDFNFEPIFIPPSKEITIFEIPH